MELKLREIEDPQNPELIKEIKEKHEEIFK